MYERILMLLKLKHNVPAKNWYDDRRLVQSGVGCNVINFSR